MIRRLAIRDLVVIAGAELEPASGLTAITGETGAGKTVLAQALTLLAGGSVDARAVRPGAKFALVEATLRIPEGFWDRLEDDDPAIGLRELVEAEDEVVVARRIPAEGRARSMVDGQAAAREAVASLVAALLRFSGQHAQRRLVSPAHQLGILDGFAGPEVLALAGRVATLRRDLRAAEQALAAAAERRRQAQSDRADLEAMIAAVEEVGPDPAEEAALRAERDRVRHAERLALGINAACDLLSGDQAGAIGQVGRAGAALEPLREIVPALGLAAERLAATQEALQEELLALRGELDELTAEPGRLDAIEERLIAYERIDRRYGPGLDTVLARVAAARETLALLDDAEASDAALEQRRDAARAAARAAAEELHEQRVEAAGRLGPAVAEQLAALAMPSAQVRVEVERDEADPPADRAIINLRANPGLPEAPIAESASGGELSRVLLALHCVSAGGDSGSAWVFDEVDAGIGGVTATAVASKLAELARSRQVLVITHLPQVAAAADRHYRLIKGEEDGMARTTIEPVAGAGLLDELCRMLGAAPSDKGARKHAKELLARRAELAD